MNQGFRWFLAFLPLMVLFGAVAAMVTDLKNPVLEAYETCTIAHVGKLAPDMTVRPFTVLFGDGGEPIHDIRLECPTYGAVMVNEPDAFRYGIVKKGMKTRVEHLAYRWLPEQWRLQIDQSSLNTSKKENKAMST